MSSHLSFLHVAVPAAMLPPMRMFAMVWCLLAAGIPLANAVPSPQSVAILYNSALPESRQLAEFYRAARGIPAENLISLEMPVLSDISREEYDRFIAEQEEKGQYDFCNQSRNHREFSG